LVADEELPVMLPLDIKNYKPKGKSPLEDHPTFPVYEKDGVKYRRECDTLDTFMCSSFYFLRYPNVGNDDALISKALAKKLFPVNFYSGGKEHTVGHLLYSRFIHKFLFDQ
jgi:leucyl-tRNA synthetase